MDPGPSFLLIDTGVSNDTKSNSSSALTAGLERMIGLLAPDRDQTPESAKALLSVGQSCERKGERMDAIKYYIQAMDAAKKTLPECHPQVADILCCLGNIAKSQNKMDEAISNLRQGLTIYRKANLNRSWMTEADKANPTKKTEIDYYLQHSTASTLCAMGMVEYKRRKLSDAMNYFTDALLDSKRAAVTGVTMDRNASGGVCVERARFLKDARTTVADMFNNIGCVHSELNNRSAAIENFNLALALQMQELGEDDPSVAVTLHNIGAMHHRCGETLVALKSFKQVLKMRRLTLNSLHPLIVDSLVNVASLHEKADEIDKADGALNAAARIESKNHGQQSVELADVKVKLGALHARCGTEETALDHYNTALEIYTESLGYSDSHPSVRLVRKSISYVEKRDEYSEQDESVDSFVNATEKLGSILDRSCGALCFDQNKTTEMPASIDIDRRDDSGGRRS